MNVHALCMLYVAVYTFVHAFSTFVQTCAVYERVRHVYGACYSVHDHTRLAEIAQANVGARGLSSWFFLEALTQLEFKNDLPNRLTILVRMIARELGAIVE